MQILRSLRSLVMTTNKRNPALVKCQLPHAKTKIPTTLSRGGDSRIQAEPDPTEAAPNYWGRTAMALPEVWWRLVGQPELP